MTTLKMPIKTAATHGTPTMYQYGCRCNSCREAQRLYYKPRRKPRSQEQISRDTLANRNKRRRYKAHINAIKNKPCMDCNQFFPLECMDFDHIPVRGPKLFSIGESSGQVSIQLLNEEIAKCDVVCANCHRIRTHSIRKKRFNLES
jgi:hypothetical protein